MKSFSISEALGYGWGKMKEEFSFVFLISLIIWGVAFLSEGLYDFVNSQEKSFLPHILLLVTIGVVTIVLTLIMQVGYLKIYLKIHDEVDDEDEAKLSDLFTYYKIAWKLAIGSLLQALIIIVGFLLFIVPGIIFALKYLFTKFIIVDKEIMPTAALTRSAQITKGAKMQLFKLALILWVMNIFGAFLIVGFFVTLPVTMFTLVYVYRELEAQTLKIEETK